MLSTKNRPSSHNEVFVDCEMILMSPRSPLKVDKCGRQVGSIQKLSNANEWEG